MSTESNSINFDSYIPYYIQLIEALKAKISRGEWKPGDKIPSEPELCVYYGVSRTVVRQALREIELDGLILRKKGKGTFIAEPKINESLVEKLTGFYQDMLERGHRTVTQVLKHEIEPCTAKIARDLHIAPGTSVFCIERLRFVDGVPIVLVTTYIPVSLCPQLADQDLSNQSLYQILERFGLVITAPTARSKPYPLQSAKPDCWQWMNTIHFCTWTASPTLRMERPWSIIMPSIAGIAPVLRSIWYACPTSTM